MTNERAYFELAGLQSTEKTSRLYTAALYNCAMKDVEIVEDECERRGCQTRVRINFEGRKMQLKGAGESTVFSGSHTCTRPEHAWQVTMVKYVIVSKSGDVTRKLRMKRMHAWRTRRFDRPLTVESHVRRLFTKCINARRIVWWCDRAAAKNQPTYHGPWPRTHVFHPVALCIYLTHFMYAEE